MESVPVALPAGSVVPFSAINGTTEADPNRRRTGSSPLADREPLSDRSFSDRPGIAGVANLTDRLLRGVRYSLHWCSVLVNRAQPCSFAKAECRHPNSRSCTSRILDIIG